MYILNNLHLKIIQFIYIYILFYITIIIPVKMIRLVS